MSSLLCVLFSLKRGNIFSTYKNVLNLQIPIPVCVFEFFFIRIYNLCGNFTWIWLGTKTNKTTCLLLMIINFHNTFGLDFMFVFVFHRLLKHDQKNITKGQRFNLFSTKCRHNEMLRFLVVLQTRLKSIIGKT